MWLVLVWAGRGAGAVGRSRKVGGTMFAAAAAGLDTLVLAESTASTAAEVMVLDKGASLLAADSSAAVLVWCRC